ncbi:MAG: hypothetical protein R3234_13035, partial [Thermoanaerobaculia bacterium]|nr:hypothetical protein [Thermoanaerobaculia bacterium]
IRELLRGLRLAARTGSRPSGFPSPADLPEAEVFTQEECRKFFAAFRDLYEDDAEAPSRLPSVEEVKERLETEGDSVEFLARLLLGPGSEVGESGEPSRPPGERLQEYLRRLERDWLKRENERLARAIREAHRAGEEDRMQRLTEEKDSLSRRVHRGPEP